MVAVAKKFVYIRRFVGEPKPSDFRLEEETLPPLKDGGKYFLYTKVEVGKFGHKCQYID